MIRVVYIAKNLAVNGITNVIMNYCCNINKNKFDITIIAGTPIEGIYREQCKINGIKIVEAPDKTKKTRQYYLAIWKELKNHYDIVHVHGNSATITIELIMAKLRGNKVRIAHCHNSTCDNIKIHKMLLPVFGKVCTHGFACSKVAGDWLFGKRNYKILQNGFDTKKFIFNSEKRTIIRNQMELQDKFVIGNVARFNNQKNHPYLLEIFKNIAKKKKEVFLLLVGDGPDLEKIQNMINNHPYKNRIIYYGITDRVEDVYNIMDVFVLPSKHEGLGIVFLEAQINGLPVVTSDQVPLEVNIGGRTEFLELSKNTDEWEKAILNVEIIDRLTFWEQFSNEIEIFDIKKNVEKLEEQYENMLME